MNFVPLMAIGLDAVPVVFDHPGKLLEGFQPLPAESVPPLVEETPRPPWGLVFPKLGKRVLEQVGLGQALVGLEQQLERFPPLVLEVAPMRQERVALAFDKSS